MIFISCRESVLGVKNIHKTGEGEAYCIKSFFLLSVFSLLPPTDTWYWCQNMHSSALKQNEFFCQGELWHETFYFPL